MDAGAGGLDAGAGGLDAGIGGCGCWDGIWPILLSLKYVGLATFYD